MKHRQNGPRFFTFKLGRDINGNSLVRISAAGIRGFSIQTNGNLPQTHRNGVGDYTHAEVVGYVSTCGTPRQKSIMGL